MYVFKCMHTYICTNTYLLSLFVQGLSPQEPGGNGSCLKMCVGVTRVKLRS